MENSHGKKTVVVTRDDGVRKTFTYTQSQDRRYLYVGLGSRNYRIYLGDKGGDEAAVAAEAIRLILDNFGG